MKRPSALLLFGIAAALIWILLWSISFGSVYGWGADDVVRYAQIRGIFEAPNTLATQPTDQQMLYVLFCAIPLSLHWALPSWLAPRAWSLEGEFRILLLIVVLVHAFVFPAAAFFFERCIRDRIVAFLSFLLFLLCPTVWFAPALLDTHFLALVPLLTALALLLCRRNYGVAGSLVAVAYLISQDSALIAVPFCALFWWNAWSDSDRVNRRDILRDFCVFFTSSVAAIFGIAIMVGALGGSILTTLAGQTIPRLTPFTRLYDFGVLATAFWNQMGWPLMLATTVGAITAIVPEWRPRYLDDLAARVLGWALFGSAFFAAIIQVGPHYNVLAAVQPLYAALAAIGIERIGSFTVFRIAARARFGFIAVASALCVIVPLSRSADAFSSQLGFGNAIRKAHAVASEKKVYFLTTYDWDANAQAVHTPKEIGLLPSGSVFVTDAPMYFFQRHPAQLAALHNLTPIARYATQWCSREAFAEGGPAYTYRTFFTEPDVCESRVYSADSYHALAKLPILRIASVTADSSATSKQTPNRALLSRDRKPPFQDRYDDPALVGDVWRSNSAPMPHWIQFTLAEPTLLQRMTIVPPEEDYIGRIDEATVSSILKDGHAQVLWHGHNLSTSAVIDVNFPRQTVRTVRITVLRQGTPVPGPVAAIAFVGFPGYRARLGR